MRASRDLLISNQVSKGFEQLGSKETVVRLGGIYALEGVMKTSEQYHKPVLEALSAFVRDGTKTDNGDDPPATDIQAALTVIGRGDGSRAATEWGGQAVFRQTGREGLTMRIDRFTLLHGLRAAAVRERERRQAAEEVQVAEARELFYRQLDEMAARRRASPGWREPTEEERAENLRQLEAWFAEHYGSDG